MVNAYSTRQVGSAVRLLSVERRFGTDANPVSALRGASVSFAAGAFTAVMGPSGSGKSTLLQIAAGLDRPTSGRVLIGDNEISGLKEAGLARYRRTHIGYVAQQFNLLPALTARQNVALPLRLDGRSDDGKAQTLLDRVGLGDRLEHLPSELSGGQQQRVAIARALIAEPAVVFADEPTGALDSHTAEAVLELLGEVVRERGQTLVMVTHDPRAAAHADRVIYLADGRPTGEDLHPTPGQVADQITRLGGSHAGAARA